MSQPVHWDTQFRSKSQNKRAFLPSKANDVKTNNTQFESRLCWLFYDAFADRLEFAVR